MATTHWAAKDDHLPAAFADLQLRRGVPRVRVDRLLYLLRFSFGQTPLQQFYTPIYLRSAAAGAFSKTDKYQLLYAAGVSIGVELASEADVQAGTTLASRGSNFRLHCPTRSGARTRHSLSRT